MTESDLSPSPTTTDEQHEAAEEADPAAAGIRPPPRSRRPQSSQLEWVLAAEDEAPSSPSPVAARVAAPAEAPAAAPVAATVAKVEAAAPATSEKRRRRSRISRLAGTPRKVVRVLLGGKKHH